MFSRVCNNLMFAPNKRLLLRFPMVLLVLSGTFPVTAQPYFTVSSEPTPSQIVQQAPVLYNAPDGRFLVAWRDARDGHPANYAQLFDAERRRVGANFKILSRPVVAFGPEQSFLVIGHENFREVPYEYRRGFSQLYGPEGVLTPPTQITEQLVPFDYVGCPAFSTRLHSTDQGYLFADAFNGSITLQAFDFDGKLIYSAPDSVLPVSYETSGFALAAHPDGSYAHFWVAAGYSLEPGGLYARVFDSSHAIIADSIFIGNRWLQCDVGETMRAVALPDSLFQLFFATSDSLWYLSLDKNGTLHHPPDFITVDHPDEVPEDIRRSPRTNLGLSNIASETFSVFAVTFYFWHDGSRFRTLKQTFKQDFAVDGTLRGNTSVAVTPYGHVRNIRKLDESRFQIPTTYQQDVYLLELHGLTPGDSLKLNDDVAGANQHIPQVIPMPHDRFLVTWQDEKGKKARPLDLDLPLVEPEFEPDFDTGWFFLTGELLSFWKSEEDNRFTLGYRIHSREWDVLQEQVLAERGGGQWWVNATAVILNEDTFLTLLQDSTELRLLNISRTEGVLVDTLITSGGTPYPVKMSQDGDGTYWAVWDSEIRGVNNIQGFDESLRPVSRRIQAEDILSSQITFLSQGRFAYLQNRIRGADERGVYLVVADTLVDGTQDETRFATLAAVNRQLHTIAHQTLLVTWVEDRAIWVQAFARDGAALKPPLKIYESDRTSDLQASSALSTSKLFIAWSDAVTPGNGFDILGKAVPLATITHIAAHDEPQPDNFILTQNYPNPFNPTTVIEYQLPQAGDVEVLIYNVLGQKVQTLVDGWQPGGSHQISWDGRSRSGTKVASGVYIYELRQGNLIARKKMIIMR